MILPSQSARALIAVFIADLQHCGFCHRVSFLCRSNVYELTLTLTPNSNITFCKGRPPPNKKQKRRLEHLEFVDFTGPRKCFPDLARPFRRSQSQEKASQGLLPCALLPPPSGLLPPEAAPVTEKGGEASSECLVPKAMASLQHTWMQQLRRAPHEDSDAWSSGTSLDNSFI